MKWFPLWLLSIFLFVTQLAISQGINCAGFSKWSKSNDSSYFFEYEYFIKSSAEIPQDSDFHILIWSPFGSMLDIKHSAFKVSSFDYSLKENPFKKGDNNVLIRIGFNLNLQDTQFKKLRLNESDSFEVSLYIDDTYYYSKYSYSNSKILQGYFLLKCKIYQNEMEENKSPTFNRSSFFRWLWNHQDAAYFSPGAIELEGDSIEFFLDSTHLAKNTLQNINDYFNLQDAWYAPFNFKYPVTCLCGVPNKYDCKSFPNQYPPIGFYFDQITGQMIFQSVKKSLEHAPIHAQCKEFRNTNSSKTMLGITEFIIEYSGLDQTNNSAPRIQSKSYVYKTCPNEDLKIEMVSTLNRYNDTSTIFWDSALIHLGADWKIMNQNSITKTAQLSWSPDSLLVRKEPYRFTTYAHNPKWPIFNNARTFLIYVRPKPTVWHNHAVKSCGQITASVDSFIDLPGTWNFHWQMIDSVNNVRLSHTGKFPDFKLPHSGKWILRLTASNDYAGCPLVVEDTLNVAPFSLFSLPDTSFCSSESVTFTPIGLQGAPPFAYLWKTAFRTDTAASLLFINTSDSVLCLQVTDANNCVFVDSLVPQVRPAPIFNFGFEGLQACVGDTIPLKVPSTFVSLPRNWTPELDDTLFAVTTSGVYSLLLNDTFHQCAFADTVLIAFQDIPKADFSFAGVCNPDSVSFHYTGTQPEGNGYDFYWLFPDTMLSGKSVSNKLSGADWIPVRVQVISYTGCRDTLTQWIPAGRHVKALFSGKDICQGDSLRFLDQSTFTYQPDHLWKFGDGNFSKAQNPVHSYPYHSESKTYLVTLKVHNDFCADSITLPVNVIESPEASFTHNSNGKTVFFTPNETPSGASYRWTFGDGDSSNLSAPSHTYKADSGTYTVCLSVTNAEGCLQTVCKQVYFNVGINNIENGINIYPNPTENLLFITSVEPLQNALLTLSDAQGKTIQQSTCNELSCTLNLKSLPKGVYTLNIENEGRVMKKVVIKL
jgi:hypothetical protein